MKLMKMAVLGAGLALAAFACKKAPEAPKQDE